MRHNLIFWGSNGNAELDDKNFPKQSKSYIQENFKSTRGFDFDWVDNQKNSPMPEQVYFVVKSLKNPIFDLFDYGLEFIVVSKALLEFINYHGYTTGFDKCRVLVVNGQGKLLTDKEYFLLRIYRTTADLHRGLIKFEQQVNIFPENSVFSKIKNHQQVYTESEQKIFTPALPFYPRLMFSETLEDEMKQIFVHPRLYTALEWVISKQKIAEAVGL